MMTRMRRLVYTSILFLFMFLFASFLPANRASTVAGAATTGTDLLNNLYQTTGLKNRGLSYEAFNLAIRGMKQLESEGHINRDNIIAIADFSQSSCNKRLYVIDIEKHCILNQTFVAHGRNSGEEFATSFSDEPQSYQSSIGFYTTLDTYTGQHGLSLRLKGEEAGYNSNAYSRAIVIHGADYVSAGFIKSNGRLGRSQGCPAIPVEDCAEIIKSLQGGTCLFIYYPDKEYISQSHLLNS